MTEGAPAAFAEHSDVTDRWRPFRDTAEQNRATTRLGDASALLRTLVKGIDARIAVDDAAAVAAGTADVAGHGALATVTKSTVVDVVIRFLQNPEGAKQLQETIGPRSYGMTFDGKATGIFFTEDELASLRPSAGADRTSTAFGTAYVGIRPGWGPLTPGWGQRW